MKRIILTILAAIALAAAPAAVEAQTTDITATIAALNAECPGKLGPGLTCIGYELKADEGVVISLLIDENRASVENMKTQAPMLTEIFASEIVSGRSPEMAQLRDYCLAASKPIIYRFAGNQSGTGFDVTIPPAQLKE